MQVKWRRLSLRSRLTLISAIAVAVTVIAVSTSCWWLIRIQLYQQLDDQLVSDSQVALDAATPADAQRALLAGGGSGGDSHDEIGSPPVVVVRFLNSAGIPTATSDGADALGPVDPTAKRIVASGTGSGVEDVKGVEHVEGGRFYRVRTVASPGGAVQVARRVGGVKDTLAHLGALLIAIGLAGSAGAGLIGWTVARAGLRPVDLLTGAVEQVARTHDLSAKIPVDGHDEIARLAEAFNAMLSALEESKAAQRQLVQDAGHELWTPLTSLRNNIELLIHTDEQSGTGRVLSAQDRARLLADLGAQAAELTTLTTELVELAGENADPEAFELIDLADLVGGAVDRARVRWPAVCFETLAEPAVLAAQPASLERALLNLLDNAAKWSPPGGKVRVRLGVHVVDMARIAEVTVADEGPGIPVEERPKVFERFYRVTSARSMPGSGLGLAIVAQAIQAHHGTVSVGDAGGGGAELRVRLSLEAAVAK